VPISDAELADLYMRYAPILHARARSILGDDAEAGDAVQETFARVIRAGDRFRQESSPLTWMYQINTNWCLNRLRDRKGHVRKHEDRREDIASNLFRGESVGGTDSGDDVEDRLDDGRLRALLADEDDQTRAMLVHLFFDDMTREQTAVAVGISVPTLRKRLDLFLKRARRALGVSLTVAALLLAVGAFR
jgi:RNA polymerase sigma-70 factor (ECF subfamily)